MAPAFPAQVIADVRVSAKQYARVSLGDEDALFDALAATALAMAEGFLRASLIVRPHRVLLPAVGGWQRLPITPVTVISAVAGVPAEGAEFALPIGALPWPLIAAWALIDDEPALDVVCSLGER